MADAERPGAENWVPESRDLAVLEASVDGCRGCELWQDATQAVFSRGAPDSTMMLVGEQPGDQEDLSGEPFVGPAGRVLEDALIAAGIDPERVYLTNAVKHFRFDQRGKRRIHAKPAVGHILACHPWLQAEFDAVHPGVVVCLGATAARSVMGRAVVIGKMRGALLDPPEGVPAPVLITTHPSSVLRVREKPEREAAFDAFVIDLRRAGNAAK